MTDKRNENDKAKIARFIFNNLGGFAALAGVILYAGQVIEKQNATGGKVDQLQVQTERVEQQTRQVASDMEVVKVRVQNIEREQQRLRK